MEIHVHEQRLPGVGFRYDIDLGDVGSLFVIADSGGDRILGLVRHDESVDWQVTLDADQAVTIAALLLGARFTLDTSDEPRIASAEIVVDSVIAGPTSPAIGLTAPQIALPGEIAFVMAVISATTPEVGELETHTCRAGDRVVFAAKSNDINDVATFIRGTTDE